MTEQERLVLSNNVEFQRALGYAITLRDAHQMAIEDLKIYTLKTLGTTNIPSITELYELWPGNP